jgi:hypothetical protein
MRETMDRTVARILEMLSDDQGQTGQRVVGEHFSHDLRIRPAERL